MSGARRRGFTLLEVVLALGVLSVLLIGLFSCLASSMRVDGLTREHQAASEAAAGQLDVYLTDPALTFQDAEAYFDVPSKVGGAVLAPPAPLPPGWTQARAGRVELRLNPDGLGSDLLRVSVSVAWRAADGTAQRVDLVSLRTR